MAIFGNLELPIITRLKGQEYELGTYSVKVRGGSPDKNGNVCLTADFHSIYRDLENLCEPGITDRILAGEKVAVIGPNLDVSRQVVIDTARELKAQGHHVHHSIGEVSLNNGGTLEAVTPMGIRGRTLDHVVILGCVDDHDVLPAVTPGGTISRR